jgi:hypothetical protein
MQRFMIIAYPVPPKTWINETCLRVTPLGVYKGWKLGWISGEEHGHIETHPIPVSLLSEVFDCHAFAVPNGLRRTTFKSSRRETNHTRGLFANTK